MWRDTRSFLRVEVVSFDDCAYREVDTRGGKVLWRIALPVPLLDAEVSINACKGKTHHMAPFTGAIKNWVGVLGLQLWQQHHDVHTFTEYADILTVTKPTLNVCDAIVVGEGDGPVANTSVHNTLSRTKNVPRRLLSS